MPIRSGPQTWMKSVLCLYAFLCLYNQPTSWGGKQGQCVFLQPYFTSHGWSCVFCVAGVTACLCFSVLSGSEQREPGWENCFGCDPAPANHQHAESGWWKVAFCLGFGVVVFCLIFFAWTKPTFRSNGILNKLFYLQWQRSNRVWIVLPVLLSLHS